MDLPAAFERLRGAGRKALIPFIMAGDPDLRTTGPLLLALQEAGADVIEVGIPFSDPLADGPVIQAASSRALARGATPPRVLDAVASVRGQLRVPVVALTYWNPVLSFGPGGAPEAVRAFARSARTSGLAGVIVPDLPVEESLLLRRSTSAERLCAVLLAAPTSPPARLRMIARAAQGFIYYVSVAGTTGARRELPPGLVHGVRQLKLLTTKPVCVGFGISTSAQAAAVARVADGVIVGSALIQAMALARGRAALRRAAAFVARLRKAV
ncbi:MAG: tryptophan synthase subunit alpha [Omnitrophica WOR_2 bacterium RIFCSPHIGHO2_02_FULL_67_20]|nr:MAG: tryptophan synthase subunit alpha [Omnitrophica WOR_2 bacterium RIFCSPHIGHO2_02_FULL_67_20]